MYCIHIFYNPDTWTIHAGWLHVSRHRCQWALRGGDDSLRQYQAGGRPVGQPYQTKPQIVQVRFRFWLASGTENEVETDTFFMYLPPKKNKNVSFFSWDRDNSYIYEMKLPVILYIKQGWQLLNVG